MTRRFDIPIALVGALTLVASACRDAVNPSDGPALGAPALAVAGTEDATTQAAKQKRSAKIKSLTMNDTVLTVGGASVSFEVVIQATGPSKTGVVLQSYLEQGAVSRSAGGAAVRCPDVAVLTAGSCTTQGLASASNTSGSGTGLLNDGPATLRIELVHQTDAGAVVLDSRTVSVFLLDGQPMITAILLPPTPLVIGSFAKFAIQIENPTGAAQSGVSVNGFFPQDIKDVLGGRSQVVCDGSNVDGEVPPGTCITTLEFSLSRSLAAGDATLEVQLIQGTDPVFLLSKRRIIVNLTAAPDSVESGPQ